jgi:hypothetical protein
VGVNVNDTTYYWYPNVTLFRATFRTDSQATFYWYPNVRLEDAVR